MLFIIMTENKYNSFHNEQAERMRRQVMDGVKQTQNYVNYTLRGQFQNQPRAHPTGSFNTMSQHSFNTANLSQMKQTEDLMGGAQTVEGHNLIMNQLKNRALQLEQLSAGLPQQERPQQAAEIPDTVSTSLELFFSSLTSSDFSLSYISSMNKEAKQALGNLKQYGLDLDKQTLERYAQITEAHLDNYLTNIDELYLGRDIFGSYLEKRQDGKQERKRGDLYLDYLERIDYYEVIFKIYLTLQALINSYGTSPDTRKQAFNEQFKNIIMAPKNKIFNPELKRIDDILKRGYKSLKDVINKSAYDEIKEYFETTKEKKKNPSLKDRGEERGLKDYEDMREEERKKEEERQKEIKKLLKQFKKENKELQEHINKFGNEMRYKMSRDKREGLLKALEEITNKLRELGVEAPPIAKPNKTTSTGKAKKTTPNRDARKPIFPTRGPAGKAKKTTGEAKEAPKQAADGGMPEFKPPPPGQAAPVQEAEILPTSEELDRLAKVYDDIYNNELMPHIGEYGAVPGEIQDEEEKTKRLDILARLNKARDEYEKYEDEYLKYFPEDALSDRDTASTKTNLTGQGIVPKPAVSPYPRSNPATFTQMFLRGSGFFNHLKRVFQGKEPFGFKTNIQ